MHYCGIPMMWIVWIPVAILMIWLIFKLSEGARNQLEKGDTPLEILRKRYASGEINTEEFEERKKVLESIQ